ncbi:MAG: hypothetical protein R3C17_11685 [Planctomycetaceae bacterium]
MNHRRIRPLLGQTLSSIGSLRSIFRKLTCIFAEFCTVDGGIEYAFPYFLPSLAGRVRNKRNQAHIIPRVM